jgi:Zn-dependent peptidase ImmA (M78 family)/transcriptional regulator with XRE-family HTH domain
VRPGTPGFIGDRLREAREARGLSAVALADVLGIARQSVSAYEQDRATPNPEVAAKAAEVLNLPFAFFLEKGIAEDTSTIYWRSMAAATKTSRVRSRRRYEWLRHIIQYLSTYVEFPSPRLPSALVVDDPGRISDKAIEEAASQARLFFGLKDGAIENVAWLLENHGLIVSFAEFGAASIDSFSQVCADGRAYAVINADHGSSVRYRYDLAHELGHLVLHRFIDRRYFAEGARNKQMEHQAHYFAASFLMPPHVFAKNFYSATLDGLKVMKRMWGVSMQAALVHAERLSIITDFQARKLWRRLSARGWRRNEPFDDVIPRENPELLRNAFHSVLQEGILTPDMILDALPYTGQEIETLCGLDRGTLVPASSSALPELAGVGARTDALKFSRQDRKSPKGEIVAFGRPDRT